MDFKIAKIVVLFLAVTHFSAQSKELTKILTTAANLTPLMKNQGYLMIYVDVSGIAPSIKISKVNTKKLDIIPRAKKLSFTKDYMIDLKGLDKGFYYVPMLEGVYQITKVNTPFYDLPYWLPTENDPRWRFIIKEQQVNFAGELNIAKERAAKVIDVNLHNRLAYFLDAIKDDLNKAAVELPLNVSSGYRDEFFQELDN